MNSIPNNYIHYKSTADFTKESVPKMFLHLHNTRAGVYGKICVITGSLNFFGYAERKGEIEKTLCIEAGAYAVSPPEYWHKVEFLTKDTVFRVDFYAEENSQIVEANLSERDEKAV
jgi:tellurite resistance-related uncharacterized protein